VVTEGGFNPIPVLVHLLAIAAGLFVGWIVMDRITPDLPADSVAAGIESSSAPGSVAGNDPDSLLLAANLGPALGELSDQLAAGQGIVTLHIEPGAIKAESSDADGTYDLDEVDPATPAVIVDQIPEQRPKLGLGQILFMDLVATRKGPRWYVQIDNQATDEPPPWTYGAPLEGSPLTVGGAPPTPIG
jgi:hypothetical protein